jgi:DNA-binding response OmpR family regulator
MRVLIVEDERKLAEVLASALRREHYDVVVAATGEDGFFRATAEVFDLLVLDVMLPGRSGLEILRTLRERHVETPVLILTARDAVDDRVLGLDLGADDYLVKPFSPKELVARVRAVLRRTSGAIASAEVLRAAGVEVDLPKRRARVEGRTVDLTPTEYQLLVTMLREPGRVFTRAQLQDALHGVAIESYERAIDAHVKNLRRKIEPEVGHPRYVLTVHGVGYRFADD